MRGLLVALLGVAIVTALIVLDLAGIENTALQRTIILLPLAIALIAAAFWLRRRA